MLNFKIVFHQCYQGTDECEKKNSIPWSPKDVTKFGVTLQERDIKFFLIELNEPVKLLWKLALFFDTSNRNN